MWDFQKIEIKRRCCAEYIGSNSNVCHKRELLFLLRDHYCFVC